MSNPVTSGPAGAHLRIAPVGAGDAALLAGLFARIQADPAAARFHPHPFTADEAAKRAAYRGLDLYAVMAIGDEPVGYGLLRGWDDGYAVPSLGICIVEEHRGSGAGRALMEYLHLAAKLRGAPAIRLKVYQDNERARRLYEALGYRFASEPEHGQLVGRLEF